MHVFSMALGCGCGRGWYWRNESRMRMRMGDECLRVVERARAVWSVARCRSHRNFDMPRRVN
jgi:hypothetical protein